MVGRSEGIDTPAVLILGGSGQLGSACVHHFLVRGWRVAAPPRSRFDCEHHDPADLPLSGADLVVNAAGVINKRISAGDASYPRVNSEFPHRLASACAHAGSRLVHISTDCVFDGERGLHLEGDAPDARDAYGRSKAEGEPLGSALVLRTSFVGPEVRNRYSLLAWVLTRERMFTGYTDQLWNGVTSLELARILETVYMLGGPAAGVRHVYGQDMDKHSLCLELARACSAVARPEPGQSGNPADRRLRTGHPDFLASLSIQPFARQVRELAPLVAADGLWREEALHSLAAVQAAEGFVVLEGTGDVHAAMH